MQNLRIQRTVVPIQSTSAVPRGGQAEPRCYVTTPKGAPPKGICHFVGGAVVGAAPQLTYGLLIDMLASSGYTVIQTPYPFSFKHGDLAKNLRDSFEECVRRLQLDAKRMWVPDDVPIHGVGHSNGALMHLLIGSYFDQPVTSNVLVSYNNKEVSDAIPIPDFISNSRPLLQQGRSLGLAQDPDEVRRNWESLFESLPGPAPPFARDLGPVLSQISSCLNEIETGTVDFEPSPEQSRDLILKKYSIPSTLLLRYSNDGIDQTPEMTQLLSQRPGRFVRENVLPGSHVSPCGGDVSWQTGAVFSPLDAAVMAGKLAQQQEVRRTAQQVVQWLDGFS